MFFLFLGWPSFVLGQFSLLLSPLFSTKGQGKDRGVGGGGGEGGGQSLGKVLLVLAQVPNLEAPTHYSFLLGDFSLSLVDFPFSFLTVSNKGWGWEGVGEREVKLGWNPCRAHSSVEHGSTKTFSLFLGWFSFLFFLFFSFLLRCRWTAILLETCKTIK